MLVVLEKLLRKAPHHNNETETGRAVKHMHVCILFCSRNLQILQKTERERETETETETERETKAGRETEKKRESRNICVP